MALSAYVGMVRVQTHTFLRWLLNWSTQRLPQIHSFTAREAEH